ncbi:MAG: tripartite tricarboxylate transporter permease [Deltaproteobacteria bacterium]|nr:tripartite tricarboxylate transporter permease [Deltaproteobacteria bacterium]
MRGVIAPESANDAKDGGDLITTLLLGFPQGASTALFIVALLALGVVPGPDMVKNHLDIIFSAVWLEGISGIMGTLIGFLLANQLAKLAQVRYSLMVPLILSFILMGALTANRDPLDLLAVLFFGVIGFFMRRFGYPRPALILGLVLGILMERYLYRSMMSYGFSWLLRPSVMLLLVLATVSFIFSLPKRAKKESQAESLLGSTISGKNLAVRLRPEAIFTLLLLGVFLAAIAAGLQWPLIAKLMPVYVAAIPGALFVLAQLFRDLTGRQAGEEPSSKGGDMDEVYDSGGLDFRTEVKRTMAFFGWTAGGATAVWLLGIVIALPLLILFYSLIEQERWGVSLLTAAGGFAFLWGLIEHIMDMQWPPGFLFQ